MLIVFLAAAAATPSTSIDAPKVDTVVSVTKSDKPSIEDFTKMMKMFDKLFPPKPDPDPVRLAQARGVAQSMWPDGLYGDLTESFMISVAEVVLDMKPSDFDMFDDKKADATGKKGAKATPKVPEKDITLREKMRREDPYFDKRMTVITATARDELKKLSPLIEPPLREGLARSLARRYTEPQLRDLQAFFSSPTGQLYARESFKTWLDSDVMRASMNSMPALIMQMPGVVERIKAASDTLPPPPKKAKPAGSKD